MDIVVFLSIPASVLLEDATFPYRLYFLFGVFRFLRARRLLKVLDGARKGVEIKFLGYAMRDRTAALTLLSMRIVLYIMCSATLMMALEIPCEGLAHGDEAALGLCNPSFGKFHLVIYYIICTFSTVYVACRASGRGGCPWWRWQAGCGRPQKAGRPRRARAEHRMGWRQCVCGLWCGACLDLPARC